MKLVESKADVPFLMELVWVCVPVVSAGLQTTPPLSGFKQHFITSHDADSSGWFFCSCDVSWVAVTQVLGWPGGMAHALEGGSCP